MVAFGFVWHNFPASEPDFFSLFFVRRNMVLFCSFAFTFSSCALCVVGETTVAEYTVRAAQSPLLPSLRRHVIGLDKMSTTTVLAVVFSQRRLAAIGRSQISSAGKVGRGMCGNVEKASTEAPFGESLGPPIGSPSRICVCLARDFRSPLFGICRTPVAYRAQWSRVLALAAVACRSFRPPPFSLRSSLPPTGPCSSCTRRFATREWTLPHEQRERQRCSVDAARLRCSPSADRRAPFIARAVLI